MKKILFAIIALSIIASGIFMFLIMKNNRNSLKTNLLGNQLNDKTEEEKNREQSEKQIKTLDEITSNMEKIDEVTDSKVEKNNQGQQNDNLKEDNNLNTSLPENQQEVNIAPETEQKLNDLDNLFKTLK